MSTPSPATLPFADARAQALLTAAGTGALAIGALRGTGVFCVDCPACGATVLTHAGSAEEAADPAPSGRYELAPIDAVQGAITALFADGVDPDARGRLDAQHSAADCPACGRTHAWVTLYVASTRFSPESWEAMQDSGMNAFLNACFEAGVAGDDVVTLDAGDTTFRWYCAKYRVPAGAGPGGALAAHDIGPLLVPEAPRGEPVAFTPWGAEHCDAAQDAFMTALAVALGPRLAALHPAGAAEAGPAA